MTKKSILYGLGVLWILFFALNSWGGWQDTQGDIFQAARSGDLAGVKILLSGDPSLLHAQNENRKTPLQFAVEGGSVEVVSFLIEQGADIKHRNIAGETALHYASGYSRIDLINLLLDKGADVNAKSGDGNTPLHYIRFMGVPEAAETLLSRGAEINARNNDGESLLTIAFNLKRPRLIRMLLEKGSEIDAEGSEGAEMVLRSAEMEEPELMEILFSKGVKINAASGMGSEILHASARIGNRSLLQRMIDEGADLDSENSSGGTLLHSVSQGGLEELVRILVEKGADPNLRDRFGRNSFDIAEDWGHSDITGFLLSNGAEKDGRPVIAIKSLLRPDGGDKAPALLEVVYIANDGFMLSSGGKVVFFDALFRNSFGYLDTPDPVFKKIVESKPPFQKIDLLFFSHAHRDHFEPEMNLRALKSHPETVLVGNGVLTDEMKAAAGKAFKEIESQIQTFDPEWGRWIDADANGIEFGVFPVNHADTGPEYVTLAYFIELNGIGILHVGDLVPASNVENFKPLGLESRDIDIVFIDPFFLRSEEGKQILEKHIRPEWIIPMHMRTNEVDRYQRELESIYPNLQVFHEPMQKKVFKK